MNTANDTVMVRRAVLWIFAYIILVNVGDELGRQTGLGPLGTALILFVFLGVLIKTQPLDKIMLQIPRQHVWFYLPLLLLATLQWTSGVDASLNVSDIIAAALLMLGVGFIEEILFRGLLFHAIERTSSTKRAIIITGVTFGLGHVVNLLRGYDTVALLSQMVVAVAIGLLLALLVAKTRSILAGAIFHVMFNFSGTITNQNQGEQTLLLFGMLIIAIVYSIGIIAVFKKQERIMRSVKS